MGIEGRWIQSATQILIIPPEEWLAANRKLQDLIDSGQTPPFKISKKDIRTNHSFVVIPIPGGNPPYKIGAMARAQYAQEGILGHGSGGSKGGAMARWYC